MTTKFSEELYPPIELLRRWINADYYQKHMTLTEVLNKYKRYDPEEVKRVLGVYDLDAEPPVDNKVFTSFPAKLRREWNKVCKEVREHVGID